VLRAPECGTFLESEHFSDSAFSTDSSKTQHCATLDTVVPNPVHYFLLRHFIPLSSLNMYCDSFTLLLSLRTKPAVWVVVRESLAACPNNSLISLFFVLRDDLHYTARHDTTRQKPACIHMYRQLTDTTAETLLSELSNKECVFELNLFLTVVWF
jgi:hypothetical protein